MFNVGYMYEMGMGVTADKNEAIKWYKKAAEKGDKDAKDKLLSFPETKQGGADKDLDTMIPL